MYDSITSPIKSKQIYILGFEKYMQANSISLLQEWTINSDKTEFSPWKLVRWHPRL